MDDPCTWNDAGNGGGGGGGPEGTSELNDSLPGTIKLSGKEEEEEEEAVEVM